MKRGLVVLTMLVLLFGSVVPSHAWSGGSQGGGRHGGGGGGWHGGGGGGWHGGGWNGGWHGGWRGGCCWGGWGWPGAFVGGLALGAAVAAPYPYLSYNAYPAYDPYPSYYAPPTAAYPQTGYVAPPAPAVQREVVYPNGRYVLYGDGVTQAWQWVWIPSASQVAPPVVR